MTELLGKAGRRKLWSSSTSSGPLVKPDHSAHCLGRNLMWSYPPPSCDILFVIEDLLKDWAEIPRFSNFGADTAPAILLVRSLTWQSTRLIARSGRY
jgi:hypothetical protein